MFKLFASDNEHPQQSRSMQWKRFAAVGVVGVLVVGLMIGLVSLYHRPLPQLVATKTLAPQQASDVNSPNIAWSSYGDQFMTLTGTQLVATNGGTDVAPTASTAKVMLALLVLQKHPLKAGEQGPTITVTQSVVDQYQQELALNESVVPVELGEQLTEYQALQATLIPSATNIADLLAIWSYGSMSAYTQAANNYAASIGMAHSHFADASGFSPATVSTATDLVRMGQVALQNPVIAQIVSQKSVSLPVAGTVQNFNIELGVNGINGIKTGNTDEAGGVLLFSAPYEGQTIIGAIMHAPDLGTALHDAPEILDSFKQHVQTSKPLQAGQIVGTYKLPWGGSVDAIAQKDLSLTAWKGTRPAIEYSLGKVSATAKRGTVVGSASFSIDGQSESTPIVLAKSPSQPTAWWRLTHH